MHRFAVRHENGKKSKQVNPVVNFGIALCARSLAPRCQNLLPGKREPPPIKGIKPFVAVAHSGMKKRAFSFRSLARQ